MVDLSPNYLDELSGQEAIVSAVRTALQAARRRRAAGQPWAADLATLAVGDVGLGKTAMGRVIANELGINWFALLGGHLTNGIVVRDWLRRLAAANRPYLVLIDEADGANVAAFQELLLPLSEGIFIEDNGEQVRLPEIVWYFTTNSISDIPLAVQSRCVLQLDFRSYSETDLATLAMRSANRLGYQCDETAAVTLGQYAQGEARKVIALMRLVITEMVANDDGDVITSDVALSVLTRRLFPRGITPPQLDIMRFLAGQKDRRAGLVTIANAIGQNPKDVQMRHERYLLRAGLVAVTTSGRQLTLEGARMVAALEAR